jgi:hypothetical protein
MGKKTGRTNRRAATQSEVTTMMHLFLLFVFLLLWVVFLGGEFAWSWIQGHIVLVLVALLLLTYLATWTGD